MYIYIYIYMEPIQNGWINLIRTSVRRVLGRGIFFRQKSPATLNLVFFNVLRALQDQFWTGIGYIDVDQKVSMTQIMYFLFDDPKSKNM